MSRTTWASRNVIGAGQALSLALLLAVGSAGCGETNGPDLGPSDRGGSAGGGGSGGGGGHGGTGGALAATPAVVWDAASKSIDVTCGSFFMGSMRFAATRDQLTAEQLALLSNLSVVDATDMCAGDGFSCAITIVEGDGSTLAIDTLEEDATCQQAEKVVSYATFRPFVDTLTCHYAKGSLPPAASDDVIAPDPRCYNGLFTSGSGDIERQIPVADVTRPLRVELDDCDQPGRLGKFSFALLDADGTTLGTSTAPPAAGPDHTCATLTTLVPGPETVTVKVSVNGATLAGDFWLHVYQPDAAELGTAVWTEASQSVDVNCSGYGWGTRRIVASREQLTASQLALLSNLRTVGESSICGVDGTTCDVTVTGADGSSQTWVAPQDGWCLAPRNDLISYAALSPLVDTFTCAAIMPGTQSVYAVSLDPLCFDRVIAQPQTTSFQVSVGDVSKALHIELDDCDQAGWAGNISFTVFDTDGTTALGTSTVPADAGPNHTCAMLTTAVSHPGPVTVVVSANVTPWGSFWLRAY